MCRKNYAFILTICVWMILVFATGCSEKQQDFQGNTAETTGITTEEKLTAAENGWYDADSLLQYGFNANKDLIRINGDLCYDRFTHLVWLYVEHGGGYASTEALSIYYGPHGRKCKYNPETRELVEIGS